LPLGGLQGLKRQHQSILEAAGDGIYGLDIQGRTTFVNPAAVRMLQWTAEELVNQPMHPLLHHTKSDGSPYPLEACPIYAAFRDGGVHAVDDEVFWRKDGTCFPVEYVSTPIREEGRVVGTVIVFKDITERKRAQDAVRASENLTKQILASSQDGINVLDAEGRLLFMNQAGEELMNIQNLASVLNMSWMDLWRGQDREAACAALEVAKAGGVGKFAGCCPTMAGEPRWWDVIVTPMCDIQGKPERFVAISRDVTDRKRMEDALRESEERFRQVTENIREVFWMTDPAKQEMLYVSPAYEYIWGRSCSSLYRAPLSWLDAIHPDDRERVRQAAIADQASGSYVEEYRIVRPDGSIRWIRDRAFPVRNASGAVYRIAGIAEDITELHCLPKT
jgi:PAS domain S-box-containing protein